MSKQPTVFSGKKMKLVNVPEDIQQIIIARQEEEIEDCDKCIRSQDYAIYKMLREHNKIMEQPVGLVAGKIAESAPHEIFLQEGDICITFKVPMGTPLGLALNYKRLEEEKRL